ncbi:MAG TPA: zinc ribbon domain-containing protein [Herpetosiphonaceae bacterium]
MTAASEARLLAEGITAAKAGQRDRARELLTQVITANASNEQAWLWMSSVLDTSAQRRECLLRVLAINPFNEVAQYGLTALDSEAQSAAKPAPPPPPKPAPAAPQAGALVICPFCSNQTDDSKLDCDSCGENTVLSCPNCEKPIKLWETTRCPCGEGLRHYIFFPDGIDHEGLGQRYAMADRWVAAARQWDRALTQGSHVAMLHRKLAQAYERIGDIEQANYHRQIASS